MPEILGKTELQFLHWTALVVWCKSDLQFGQIIFTTLNQPTKLRNRGYKLDFKFHDPYHSGHGWIFLLNNAYRLKCPKDFGLST